MQTIRSFRDAPSAYIAASVLDAAEIPNQIVDEHIVGINWLWSDAIGGVKVQVPAEFIEAAVEALGEVAEESEPESAEGERLGTRAYAILGALVLLIVLLLVGIPRV